MATYTKQELIEAYILAKGLNPSTVGPDYITDEVARVQAELDQRVAQVTANRDAVQNRLTVIQNRLDNMETSAKAYMKGIALDYLGDQFDAQNEIDNAGVNL